LAKKLQKDLTQGSVPALLIRFALPFLASNIMQALYNVADMMIVGWYVGPEGITGVNIGGMVTMAMTALVIGFSLGGTVLVSQFVGAKREQDASETIGTLFTMFAIAGAALTAIGLLVAQPVLRLINTPAEAFAEAADYLSISMSGLVFIFGYNAVSAVLRGAGDSTRPMVFVAIATGTNIVLDLLMVGSLDMGASGAALATVISQGVSFTLAVVYLYRQDFLFDFKLRSFRISREKMRKIFRIGFPSAMQMTLTNFSFLTIASLINSFGVFAASGTAIGQKIDSFAILPGIAFSSAISAMVGQNIGARQFDRARKTVLTGLAITVVVSLFIAGVVNLFPRVIVSAFDDTPEVLAYGISYLRYSSVHYAVVSVVFSINGLANGTGNTMFSFVNSLLSSIVMRVGLSYAFVLAGMGVAGLYLSIALSPILSAAVALYFLFSGRWKKTKIIRAIVEDGPQEQAQT